MRPQLPPSTRWLNCENGRIRGNRKPRRVLVTPPGRGRPDESRIDMPKPTCAVPGCEKPSRTRGWCEAHYSRWKKNGDPGPAETRTRTSRRKDRGCSVSGCERPHNSVGLCNAHYQRWKTTRDIGPETIRGYLASEVRDDSGRKQCRICLEWLDLGNFILNRATADGLDGRCKSCRRGEKLVANFRITMADYLAMLDAQGGACAVCREVPTPGNSLHVDHDHACCPEKGRSCGRCVRKLLCADCNRAIGMFKDNPEVLRAAAAYLEEQRG